MAWRSSGTNNDEMVNNLKRFGVIHSQVVEDGFRAVDRRFFVPQNRQEVAHSDQPLKEGNVHISAPHIYGSVLEALELVPGSSLSFLNLGSGTGYLSCIVAEILGPTSSNYGIEIHADVVQHANQAMAAWKASKAANSATGQAATAHMQVLHGNALQIDLQQGECLVGFDRIYIGASVEKRNLSKLAALLRPGGILVGPVDDELVKVVRIGSGQSEGSNSASASPRSTGLGGSPQQQQQQLSDDFTQQVLSGVRFAPLVPSPATPTVIPSQVWNPAVHQYYPPSFRKSCKELLLCSLAPQQQQPLTQQPTQPLQHQQRRMNLAGMLPRAVWMEILSYTHRDWFEPPRCEEAFLRRRLREEQQAAARAQQARVEAETRLAMAERERDVYRLLALRWQSRLQAVMQEQQQHQQRNNTDNHNNNNNNIDEDALVVDDITQAATAVFANEPVMLRLGGLGAMIRRFQQDSDDEEEEEDEDEHQVAAAAAAAEQAAVHDMEDDDDEDDDEAEMEDEVAAMVEDMDSADASVASVAAAAAAAAAAENVTVESMAISPASELASAVKVRAVSITSGGNDL